MSDEEEKHDEMPLPMVLTEFDEYIHKRMKSTSAKVYMSCVKRYFKLGNKIDEPKHYADFVYSHMINKRSSHYYDIMLKFIKWLNIDKYKKKEILNAYSMIKKKYYDPKKETEIISRDERLKVINAMESYKHRIIGLIQEECGVRAGDVLRLKRGNINYGIDGEGDNAQITMVIKFQQKGDKVRVVNIFDNESIKLIREFIQSKFLNSEYYFLDDTHIRDKEDELNLYYRNYYMYWSDLKKACEKLSIEPHKFTSHDIRRNFSSEMFQILDKNIVELQRVMGHQDINTTLRYLRYSGLQDKDAFRKRNELNKK